jgi:hypothetical protein
MPRTARTLLLLVLLSLLLVGCGPKNDTQAGTFKKGADLTSTPS